MLFQCIIPNSFARLLVKKKMHILPHRLLQCCHWHFLRSVVAAKFTPPHKKIRFCGSDAPFKHSCASFGKANKIGQIAEIFTVCPVKAFTARRVTSKAVHSRGRRVAGAGRGVIASLCSCQSAQCVAAILFRLAAATDVTPPDDTARLCRCSVTARSERVFPYCFLSFSKGLEWGLQNITFMWLFIFTYKYCSFFN